MGNRPAVFFYFIKRHALGLVIGISGAVFLSRLLLLGSVTPELVHTADFDGYIRLGRQIFTDFNFVVTWYCDFFIAYPPFFSILIQLVTFIIKDPLEAIRLINIAGMSFAPVFLFMGARKIVSLPLALILVPLAHYQIGLMRPLLYLRVDNFFAFLTAVLFWLIWKTAHVPTRRPWIFLGTGFLISIVFLTKFHGVLYLVVAIISIWLFQDKASGLSLRRKAVLILAGFLPLYMAYQAIIHQAKDKYVFCDPAVATLIDTNNSFVNRNDNLLHALNDEGKEFIFWDKCRGNTVISIVQREWRIIFKKYFKGLTVICDRLPRVLLPFLPGRFIIPISVWGVLLILVGLCVNYNKNLVYLVLFISGLALVPLFDVYERYYMPFVYFYFLLGLRGLENLWGCICRLKTFKVPQNVCRTSFLAFLCILATIYSYQFVVQAYAYPRYYYDEYYKAAEWLQDQRVSKPLKIMAWKNHMAFLSGSRFIPFPYEFDLGIIVRFAQSKGVDYMIIERKAFSFSRKEQWRFLKEAPWDNYPLSLSYYDKSHGNEIFIYKIGP